MELEKLAESKVGKKQFLLGHIKGVDEKLGTVEGHVSTFDYDRMDERFAPGSLDVKNFEKNPVVMWDHGHSEIRGRLPIGKSVSMAEDDKGLFSKTQLDQGDPFALQILGLYSRGFLNAFSVGFIPKDFRIEDRQIDGVEGTSKGLVWTDAELLEYSAVSIPANPGALVSRDIASLARKTLGSNSIAMVEAFGNEKYFSMPIFEKALLESEFGGIMKAFKPIDDNIDLSESLNLITELARTCKGADVDESRLSLLKSTADLFYEIIAENDDGVSREMFDAMQDTVKTLGEAVSGMYPAHVEQVRKALLQVKKSLQCARSNCQA